MSQLRLRREGAVVRGVLQGIHEGELGRLGEMAETFDDGTGVILFCYTGTVWPPASYRASRGAWHREPITARIKEIAGAADALARQHVRRPRGDGDHFSRKTTHTRAPAG